MTEEAKQHWALDKRIPIALIVTIFLQTTVFAFWLGGLSNRVGNLEVRVAESSTDSDRLTRLETQLGAINDTLRRLERGLDKLSEK